MSHRTDDENGEYNEEEFVGILALANEARELYAVSHALHDLEDSIAYLRDAFSVAPHDHAVRAEVLHKLAYDLYVFSQEGQSDAGASAPQSASSSRTGCIVDENLNDSIRLHRLALKLLPSHHSARAIYMTRLAIALRARFLVTTAPRDVNECIVLHSRALELRPPGHADRAQSLLNLANAYWARFEHMHDAVRGERFGTRDDEVFEVTQRREDGGRQHEYPTSVFADM